MIIVDPGSRTSQTHRVQSPEERKSLQQRATRSCSGRATGDSILFIMDTKHQLLLGFRRANMQPTNQGDSPGVDP
ncbi:hypothetical protein COP2_013433 [Malus domestica]